MNRYIKHVIRNWKSHGTIQLATFIVLIATFSVVNISLLIHKNLKDILNKLGHSIQVSVYLKDPINKDSLERIRSIITSEPYFKDVQYISKKLAFENFKKQNSHYIPDIIFDKNFENPLPSSFEMKVTPSEDIALQLEKVKEFTQTLGAVEGVDDISYGRGWVDNYTSFLKAFSYVSGTLISVLLAGSLFVIGSSIKSSIFQKQKEIEVFELVGATPSFIRRPYIIDGLCTGFLATALSLLICYSLFFWQSQVLKNQLEFWSLPLSFFTSTMTLTILCLGTSLGIAGSWLCISQINNGWAATRGVNKI